ncbi:Peroxisomal membrane protein PMP27 [Tulasnella sp. JGI-2019a]|nr:Peroxisomal membrane protein PMP27 [Tulasnella sp. JGI-2019a]
MSLAVSQVLFHPTVSQSLRVWSTTVGRDKTYRAIQYFARFYAWFLLKRGGPANALSASQWNSLKSALGSGRKMLRLFKPIEHLQAALSTSSSPYQLEFYSAVARQLSYAGYLAFDSLVWANGVKFIALDKDVAVRVNKISQRFWLAGILFSIGGGMSKLNRQLNAIKQLKRSSTKSTEKGDDAQQTRDEIRALNVQSAAVRYQLIQDLLDFWLPASTLGYVNINDGAAGIIGLMTSVMAFNLQWKAAGLKK